MGIQRLHRCISLTLKIVPSLLFLVFSEMNRSCYFPFSRNKKPRAGPIAVQKEPFCEIVTFWLVQNCAKEIANLGGEKPMTKKKKKKKKTPRFYPPLKKKKKKKKKS